MTADATFHMAVVAASHNDVMTALYADLGEVLRDWLRDDVGGDMSPETHMDHSRLVDAIRAGDEATAAVEAAAYPGVQAGAVDGPPPATERAAKDSGHTRGPAPPQGMRALVRLCCGSGADGVQTAVHVDDLARGLREPVAQQGDDAAAYVARGSFRSHSSGERVSQTEASSPKPGMDLAAMEPSGPAEMRLQRMFCLPRSRAM